jgi:hypothetical protein
LRNSICYGSTAATETVAIHAATLSISIPLTIVSHTHDMAEPAPVSFHLDLYRYWLSKRDGRRMPARDDIDPAEIPLLLPYISIVHKVEGEFRFRLVGSAIARQFGHELTGNVVGTAVGNPSESTKALKAVGEFVFTNARPVFATGQHETRRAAFHHVSTLLLPLSGGGEQVNMIIFTRVACFTANAEASRDWLADVPFRLGDFVEVQDYAHLTRLCFDWQRQCSSEQKLHRTTTRAEREIH